MTRSCEFLAGPPAIALGWVFLLAEDLFIGAVARSRENVKT